MTNEYHIPVLLNESIDGLDIKPNGVYLDVTLGGAGHTREILKRMRGGYLLGFDQDKDAFANKPSDDRFILVRHNFKYITNFVHYHGFYKVDSILADLGVSSHEFDVAERGFSFRFKGDLDMRMNQDADLSAKELVNEYDEESIANVLFKYGELRNSRRLAKMIVNARSDRALNTISDLKEALLPATPKGMEHKFLAKVFQALRIEVNREMEALEQMLESTLDILKPGGRLSVITYHSLEDRMVKNFMKNGMINGKPESDLFGNVEREFKLINRKVIVPNSDELKSNPRSRSAKLRVAERL